MTENEEPISQEAQAALSRGASDGPELMAWLDSRGTDIVGAVAMLAWSMAYLVVNAPDDRRSNQILNGFCASLQLYSEFLIDMQKADQAEQAEQANTSTEETRH